MSEDYFVIHDLLSWAQRDLEKIKAELENHYFIQGSPSDESRNNIVDRIQGTIERIDFEIATLNILEDQGEPNE